MIYILKSRQRKGKTTVLVGLALHYVRHRGYKPSEIYSLVRLFNEDGTELQGYHFMGIREMREFVLHMIEKDYKHIMLLIDEIDRVFPHRFWYKLSQFEALLGLWQDEKLGYVIIGTCHIGKAIDKLLREVMQMVIICNIVKPLGIVKLTIIDILNKKVKKRTMHNVKYIQKLFDTWQPVKM